VTFRQSTRYIRFMNLLRSHEGEWWLWSPSNEHWRARGVGNIYSIATTPDEMSTCQAKINELTALWGPPPDDTQFGLSKMSPMGIPAYVLTLPEPV